MCTNAATLVTKGINKKEIKEQKMKRTTQLRISSRVTPSREILSVFYFNWTKVQKLR